MKIGHRFKKGNQYGKLQKRAIELEKKQQIKHRPRVIGFNTIYID